jgi:hypothetical protein
MVITAGIDCDFIPSADCVQIPPVTMSGTVKLKGLRMKARPQNIPQVEATSMTVKRTSMVVGKAGKGAEAQCQNE